MTFNDIFKSSFLENVASVTQFYNERAIAFGHPIPVAVDDGLCLFLC